MKNFTGKIAGLSAVLLTSYVGNSLAQPAPAEVAPQPKEQTAADKAARQQARRQNALNRQNPARQNAGRQKGEALQKAMRQIRPEILVNNFEAMFGRKLTADETQKVTAASTTRDAAVEAANETWVKQFLLTTGMTEQELMQKQREFRQKQREARLNQPGVAPRAGNRPLRGGRETPAGAPNAEAGQN
jgi:hypothetical protein